MKDEPAFPLDSYNKGMTLREYFAGQDIASAQAQAGS